jgi:hypothetical protein
MLKYVIGKNINLKNLSKQKIEQSKEWRSNLIW